MFSDEHHVWKKYGEYQKNEVNAVMNKIPYSVNAVILEDSRRAKGVERTKEDRRAERQGDGGVCMSYVMKSYVICNKCIT